MGLFSSLRSLAAPSFDPQKAIMTIVVAAVKADGQVADEEVMRIRSMCARSPIFRTNSVDQDTAIINFADSVTTQLGHDAIVQAGRRRLRPILMTTLTTVLGLTPLAIGLGEGSELQSPLARVVVGGLLASTAITLVLIPAIYLMVERRREARRARRDLRSTAPARPALGPRRVLKAG